jgi:hypothetical protein
VQSVEFLELIANPQRPPLDHDEMVRIKHEFEEDPDQDVEALRRELQPMEDGFSMLGNLSSWTPEILDKIDECFVRCYIDEDGEPLPYLFFPSSSHNLNRFTSYCNEVDIVLRKGSKLAPPFVREYFLYYSIMWQTRGWPFPVPLGTKSVVGALHRIAKKYTRGFSEVSALLACVTLTPAVR